jgi:hypothetical protein
MIFKSIELSTPAEQDIRIYPDPDEKGIQIEYKNSEDKFYRGNILYLNEEAMQAFIKDMIYMLDYVKEKENAIKTNTESPSK